MTQVSTLREAAQQALEGLVAGYAENHPNSRQLAERAKASLPGGNTRTGVYMPPFPIYVERGEGVYIYDADGHRLLDFVNNNTALILGHAHPDVVEALQQQVARGTAFSRPLALEVELAELLCQRLPSLERLRFCSSGTEAVVQALRVAKTFTGKVKVAKFEGAYHGVGEHAMVSYVPPLGDELGPDDRPRSVHSSTGLSPAMSDEVVVLPFNDAEACARIIAENADDLAAVIVDPLSTGAGFALPVDGFLTRLHEMTAAAGALLIFDEIISLRASRGGAQELFGVRPDLTCLAKVVAGGTPGAAFGGRADVMAAYDPTEGAPQIPHSGTYNGNPLSMVAGLVVLRALTEEVCADLEARTQRLAQGLQGLFDAAGVAAHATAVGSLFRIHFMAEKPRNYRQAALNDGLMSRWLFFSLLERGIHWGDHGNVSTQLEDTHVDAFLAAVEESLENLK